MKKGLNFLGLKATKNLCYISASSEYNYPDEYSKPSQTSKMERFAKKKLTAFTRQPFPQNAQS